MSSATDSPDDIKRINEDASTLGSDSPCGSEVGRRQSALSVTSWSDVESRLDVLSIPSELSSPMSECPSPYAVDELSPRYPGSAAPSLPSTPTKMVTPINSQTYSDISLPSPSLPVRAPAGRAVSIHPKTAPRRRNDKFEPHFDSKSRLKFSPWSKMLSSVDEWFNAYPDIDSSSIGMIHSDEMGFWFDDGIGSKVWDTLYHTVYDTSEVPLPAESPRRKVLRQKKRAGLPSDTTVSTDDDMSNDIVGSSLDECHPSETIDDSEESDNSNRSSLEINPDLITSISFEPTVEITSDGKNTSPQLSTSTPSQADQQPSSGLLSRIWHSLTQITTFAEPIETDIDALNSDDTSEKNDDNYDQYSYQSFKSFSEFNQASAGVIIGVGKLGQVF